MNKSEMFWNKTATQWDKQADQLDRSSIEAIGLTGKYLKDGDIVLEYGCGTGSMALEMASRVKVVHAIDFSAGMIQAAINRAGKRRIENVHFERSTIFNESLQPGSYQVVTAYNILHLVEDLQMVIRRVNELLIPGGYFISVSACLKEENPIFRYALPLLSRTGLVPHVNIFGISELETSITNTGFQIVEAKQLESEAKSHYIAARKIR
jgi:ubiquinone/menaquinone biosynthesis C-methylase UbiE